MKKNIVRNICYYLTDVKYFKHRMRNWLKCKQTFQFYQSGVYISCNIRYNESKRNYRQIKMEILYLRNRLFHVLGKEIKISVQQNRADWIMNRIKGSKYLNTKPQQFGTILPKKPVNKFIIFCREEKQLLKENQGDPVLSKMEIMRLLTMKWKMMCREEKQVPKYFTI